VNLSDYLDTGLFLDHRKTRSLVRAAAPGKRVLNLFCYTASFSVYAAAGGALSVDSVDLSNTYLDWAKTNFALNGMEAREFPPWRLVRADARAFLDGAEADGLRWDLIVLDPPAFSNSKKMAGTLDLRRDHQGLVAQCLRLLSPGGQLLFSANAKGFRLDPAEFPGVVVEDLREKIRDEDFAGKRLPGVYRFFC
jgi:23S rRNA G2069 N7-methylase RlmK/C1962 C5-methylase RlmI